MARNKFTGLNETILLKLGNWTITRAPIPSVYNNIPYDSASSVFDRRV